MTKQKFKAATTIRMGDERIEAGETLELDAKQAAPLLESGAIVKPSAKGDASDTPTGTNPAAPKAEGGTDPAPAFSGAVAGPDEPAKQATQRK